MNRLVCLAALALLTTAACGEGDEPGGKLHADAAYFLDQRFDCDPQTRAPSCPPGSCDVGPDGSVENCLPSCGLNQLAYCTAFQFTGEAGIDLCVPEECTVTAENTPPVCSEKCADDDITCYVMEIDCG